MQRIAWIRNASHRYNTILHRHTLLPLVLVAIDRITGSDTLKVPKGRYSNWSQNKAAIETAEAASAGAHTHTHTHTLTHTHTHAQNPLWPWHLGTDTK